ncbi:spermidine synthase, partial [Lichenihabitans sp. Uapishka_5]|nr:spermidine synthase [Lichenihabitans sp. Uapishka_5]
GPAAADEVAEIVPAVVEWARGPLAHLSGDAMADPRVDIQLGDVARRLQAGRARYDAILLDVDNGPVGLTRDGNDGLYGPKGLRAAFTALVPGGALAVWSAFPDRAFGRQLDRAGFLVAEHSVRAQGRKGTSHVIWVAMRPGGAG